MPIGNVQIVTFGWYSSVAVDTPGIWPESEAIAGLGWLVGSIPIVWTTAEGRLFAEQFMPIIPKRFKFGR